MADFPPGPQSVGVGQLTGMWQAAAADTSQIQTHTLCLEGVAPGQPESGLQRAGQLQAARPLPPAVPSQYQF